MGITLRQLMTYDTEAIHLYGKIINTLYTLSMDYINATAQDRAKIAKYEEMVKHNIILDYGRQVYAILDEELISIYEQQARNSR